MKQPSSQQGVALVITLVMLSLVTVMAVVFLSISRRERFAVTVTSDQITARLMVDAAYARAQSEMASRMMTASNLFNYDAAVSTNYLNVRGYDRSDFALDALNVNYRDARGRALDAYNQAVNIGNLLYDPRPPVYIRPRDGAAGPLDFRFYLDFNRNGRFDPSGLLPERGPRGRSIRSGTANIFTRFIGDPQWIGVLEYPGAPHSPTNRFIGRYAYLVIPEGKTLDLNAIYNQIKRPRARQDFFVRNQGVGPWEINLAAFLHDLDFNVWSQYGYMGPLSASANRGNAFRDALSLLDYRSARQPLALLTAVANPRRATLTADFVDNFSNGPFLEENSWLTADANDAGNQEWYGSDFRRAYADIQQLFDPSEAARGQPPNDNFVFRLRRAGEQRDTHDQYAFYRMISQLGTDSKPDLETKTFRLALLDGVPRVRRITTRKLNLNYNNLSANSTNFVDWQPRSFFMNAAQLLMMANLNTNPPSFAFTNRNQQLVLVAGTNFYQVGDTYVNKDFALTNIQIWPRKPNGRHEYSANIHQLLQLAANLCEPVTTNRPYALFAAESPRRFPVVFRPRFQRLADGRITISDFAEVTNNAAFQLTLPWRDLDLPADRAALHPDDNVYGIPWVIGAVKGLPNFNEFSVRTTVQVTRKLEMVRAGGGRFQTNQMVAIGISNLFGLELWNSYDRPIPRAIRLHANVQCSLVLTNSRNLIMRSNRIVLGSPNLMIPARGWTNQQFRVPISTNYTVVQSALYDFASQRLVEIPPLILREPRTELFRDRGIFPVTDLGFAMTNRVQCFMIDEETGRILDFVNLNGLELGMNLGQEAARDPTGDFGRYWDGRRLNDATNLRVPTIGILEQIQGSLGLINVPDTVWRSFARLSGAGGQKESEVDQFRRFMGFPPIFGTDFSRIIGTRNDPILSPSVQLPLNPTMRFFRTVSWQANDPLVHYTVGDLTDHEGLAAMIRPQLVVPPDRSFRDSETVKEGTNLYRRNRRYRPWPSIRGAGADAYDPSLKDPLIRRSDDWQFPTNKYPNIGWIGRVHRGTPWQTVYLKSALGRNPRSGELIQITDLVRGPATNRTDLERGYPFETLVTKNSLQTVTALEDVPQAAANPERANLLAIATNNWFRWSGSLGTHPTNDWRIPELFTTAINDNNARGLLSVNQNGLAAWSAVLSGVVVQTNLQESEIQNRDLTGPRPAAYRARIIPPAGLASLPGVVPETASVSDIVNGPQGINAARKRFPGGRFQYLGDVLSAAALTLESPFLDRTNRAVLETGIDDFAYERIPQQVLSLLKSDEPRITVYAFGQSLRPAEASLRTEPNPERLFNLCTNYQITGEFASKRVIRFEGSVTNLQAVVESDMVIPGE